MMPNAKILEEKKALVASLVEKIKNSPAGVLVDYKGINVEEIKVVWHSRDCAVHLSRRYWVGKCSKLFPSASWE